MTLIGTLHAKVAFIDLLMVLMYFFMLEEVIYASILMITEKSPIFSMGPITDNISINISIYKVIFWN